ncbi:MAG: hypothetical protein AAF402_04795 [Pseudomonadota bacterium]
MNVENYFKKWGLFAITAVAIVVALLGITSEDKQSLTVGSSSDDAEVNPEHSLFRLESPQTMLFPTLEESDLPEVGSEEYSKQLVAHQAKIEVGIKELQHKLSIHRNLRVDFAEVESYAEVLDGARESLERFPDADDVLIRAYDSLGTDVAASTLSLREKLSWEDYELETGISVQDINALFAN